MYRNLIEGLHLLLDLCDELEIELDPSILVRSLPASRRVFRHLLIELLVILTAYRGVSIVDSSHSWIRRERLLSPLPSRGEG